MNNVAAIRVLVLVFALAAFALWFNIRLLGGAPAQDAGSVVAQHPPAPSVAARASPPRLCAAPDEHMLAGRFEAICPGVHLSPGKSRSILSAVSSVERDDDCVLVGNQAWNRLSIEEICDPYRYYVDASAVSSDDLPFIVLSYGKRLDLGRDLLFNRIGADPTRVDEVSFPSVDLAYQQKDYVAVKLFRNAASASSLDDFTNRAIRGERGHFLATMNQWTILQRLADGTYPDNGILVVEDDLITVPDFKRKLADIVRQLARHDEWDVVFLSTAHHIKGTPGSNRTQNLWRTSPKDPTRCFSAVMLSRRAAVKILAHGASRDDFMPVDHLFNYYIRALDLVALMAEPPLAFEGSKLAHGFPCDTDRLS
ncbi:Glycosyl transferase 64 domain-containing protein [Plasmodiophora brassicae]|uniref:Uncharacterized protein n=1 Tax=Plasmodiophora brassicae TaxID=37360 RepID=A0A0G4J1Z3_PLABS|nr:hypothetical protein PBRA_001917 [Plasmodiophora brassicae]